MGIASVIAAALLKVTDLMRNGTPASHGGVETNGLSKVPSFRGRCQNAVEVSYWWN